MKAISFYIQNEWFFFGTEYSERLYAVEKSEKCGREGGYGIYLFLWKRKHHAQSH